ncbi:MAG: TrkH family potassium uptake protein [Clostridia bacterium]|nr:TrkH family potassium uptake protein [Clostridia bacterium]
MFVADVIGGSPVGTAGGIKTVTVAVLMISALESVQGRNEVSVFGRRISKSAVTKSVAVCMTSVTIVVLSTLLLSATTDADLADVLYETVSATATVGLSRNLTPGLNELGKLILIVTMYLGRVGPISFALALNSNRKKENIIKEPTEDISVG